jgi:hypothetical protein
MVMDKTRLRSIGASVALAGLASIVLALIGFNLRILMWIDLWGEGVGWAIRAAIVVVGGAIFAGASLLGEEAPAQADGG